MPEPRKYEVDFEHWFCRCIDTRTDKFTDALAIGIPDRFIASPKFGMWAEFKYIHRKLHDTLPRRSVQDRMSHPLTGPQKKWLRDHWMMPLPSGVIVGTNTQCVRNPYLWIAVPTPRIEQFLEMRFEDVPWKLERPSVQGIIDSLREFSKIPATPLVS